ncbi:MAG: hypothetical protein COB15_06650 [Flavobacteriales bacterium]|nr:MAG: hypothetical protein COB15_06650 [Flavobacteriales bacterium]
MAKIEVKQSITNKPKYFLRLIVFAIVIAAGFTIYPKIMSLSKNIDSSSMDEVRISNNLTVEEWKKFMDDEIISKMRDCLKANHTYSCIIEFEEKLSNEDLALKMLTTLNHNEIKEVMRYAQNEMQKVADKVNTNQ